MFAFLRTNISKLAAPYLLGLVLFCTARLGMPLPAEAHQILTDFVSVFGAATLLAAKGLVERMIARRTNPQNTAR